MPARIFICPRSNMFSARSNAAGPPSSQMVSSVSSESAAPRDSTRLLASSAR